MKNFEFKLIPSYHKCFQTDPVSDFAEIENGSVLLGEMFAFQAVMSTDGKDSVQIKINSELDGKITAGVIKNVPVENVTYPQNTDTDYLNNKQPGMYPDYIVPLGADGNAETDGTTSLWIEAEIPETAKPGTYTITVGAYDGTELLCEKSLKLEVIGAVLPEQKLIFAEWFHSDCLATYYGVEPLSEDHWCIIENFVNTAVRNGINMLYMPTFTPALDTEVGGERPTVQLVGVTVTDGGYEFDFSLVDRWLDMCERCGIKYHEIAHTFTQWGAEHAPKVMATVGGEYKKIFGWETDSLSDEYIGFIRSYITTFKSYLKSKNLLDKCMFHISDEPAPQHFATYKAIHDKLDDILSDCICGDALSSYEFYSSGAVRLPIVGTNSISKFLEEKIPNLWCYYCCAEHEKVSNRFIAMTLNRTRVIGMQMFKYDIAGFLHWGYNFYYSQYSKIQPIDPYTCNNGNGEWPGGDTFSVYPAPGGTAYETIRIRAFTQALQDMRAFELAASLSSKEEVVKLIEDIAGEEIKFDVFPSDRDFSEKVRLAVNEFIKARI